MRPAAAVSPFVLAALLTAGPALAGAPYRTDDPGTTEHWEIDLFSTGTNTRAGTSGVLPGLEVDYGVLPRVQLHISAPLGYTTATGKGFGSGYGDTELGVKIRIIDATEEDWWPKVAIFPLVEVPTGNQRMGFSTGHTQVFLPVWVGKEFGDWSTSAGGGHWTNPGPGNKDWWYAGWAVQYKLEEGLTVGGEIFHQTASVAGGKASTGFNLGLLYDLSDNWHVLVSAGRGVQNAADTNAFSYYTALQLTF